MKTVTMTFTMMAPLGNNSAGKTELVMIVNGERWTSPMDICELLCKGNHEIFIELTDEVASQFTLAPHPSETHD